MVDDPERLLAMPRPPAGGGDEGIRIMGLGLAGRRDEARRLLLDMRSSIRLAAFQTWSAYLLAWLDRQPEVMLAHLASLHPLRIQEDPEAIFLEGWLLCEVAERERGLAHLQRAVAKGYFAAPTLAFSRHFDALRSDPAFRALQHDADAGRARALAAFREAGGERLLGRQAVRAA
jgi:hypothetical protein